MATNGMTINGLNPLSALTADDKIPVWDTGASGEPTKEITAQNMANSVKSLASLPNTTEMNTAIAQSTAISNVEITAESGYTNGLLARKTGNIVCISGYVNANSAYSSSETTIGNVAAGARPYTTIRIAGALSGAPWNPPKDMGAVFITANGNITVVAPANNTNKTIYFSVSYVVQN